jgi:uncharacterized protein (DUF433 family)
MADGPTRVALSTASGSKENPMHLEDYFDFLSPDDIRIKGHRIGIESVLYEYVHRSRTPEQIADHFDTLTLEEVYATILYYLRNQEAVDAYIAAWLEHGPQMRRAQAAANAENRNYPDFQARMRRARAEREARETVMVSAADPE